MFIIESAKWTDIDAGPTAEFVENAARSSAAKVQESELSSTFIYSLPFSPKDFM